MSLRTVPSIFGASKVTIGATAPTTGDLEHAHWSALRNGLPARPYIYRGSDHAEAAPAPVRARRTRPGEVPGVITPAALLSMCEAIDGPGPEWYRELAQEETDAPQMPGEGTP